MEAISHGFAETEERWPAREKEAFALIFALRRRRHRLLGRDFTLRTDCKPLMWLRGCKDAQGKLGRWALTLEDFEPGLNFEHISGTSKTVADALSRVKIAALDVVDDWKKATLSDPQLHLFHGQEGFSMKDGYLIQETKKGTKVVAGLSF